MINLGYFLRFFFVNRAPGTHNSTLTKASVSERDYSVKPSRGAKRQTSKQSASVVWLPHLSLNVRRRRCRRRRRRRLRVVVVAFINYVYKVYLAYLLIDLLT